MKYSEAKKTILKLRAHGWYREMPGTLNYRKDWRSGDMRLMQLMSAYEIINSLFELDFILQRYEERAVYEFKKYRDKNMSIRGGFKRYEV